MLAVVAAAVTVSCSGTARPARHEAVADVAVGRLPAPETAVPAAPVAVPTPTTTTTVVATPPPPPPRSVSEGGFAPFATVRGVTVFHPAARIEHVGFHQSNHEGAQELEPLPTPVPQLVLDSRERLTGPRSAADIVADPLGQLRAPVTGTVKRAGSYVLYCRHHDEYAVIEPDGHPGLEVKLLHVTGLHVRAGQRVVAGETLLADHPTQLPFESQVDERRTADPAWPHVHLEVVDLSIPNRPNPGGGGGCP